MTYLKYVNSSFMGKGKFSCFTCLSHEGKGSFQRERETEEVLSERQRHSLLYGSPKSELK